MNGDQNNDEKKIKSMEDDLNSRIGNILDQIDYIKSQLYENPLWIINYAERLHALFILLASKLGSDNVKKQTSFEKQLNENYPLMNTLYDQRGHQYKKPQPTININTYPKFKLIIDEREMHLLSLIERISNKRRVV